jgi:hypothetical protein
LSHSVCAAGGGVRCTFDRYTFDGYTFVGYR